MKNTLPIYIMRIYVREICLFQRKILILHRFLACLVAV